MTILQGNFYSTRQSLDQVTGLIWMYRAKISTAKVFTWCDKFESSPGPSLSQRNRARSQDVVQCTKTTNCFQMPQRFHMWMWNAEHHLSFAVLRNCDLRRHVFDTWNTKFQSLLIVEIGVYRTRNLDWKNLNYYAKGSSILFFPESIVCRFYVESLISLEIMAFRVANGKLVSSAASG